MPKAWPVRATVFSVPLTGASTAVSPVVSGMTPTPSPSAREANTGSPVASRFINRPATGDRMALESGVRSEAGRDGEFSADSASDDVAPIPLTASCERTFSPAETICASVARGGVRYPNSTVSTIAITNATAMDSAYTHIRSNTGIVSNEEKANAVVVTPRTIWPDGSTDGNSQPNTALVTPPAAQPASSQR